MRKRNGFTLVELLVVIAIISILAALLMPALEEALRQARVVKCQGQLKQAGVMIAFYGNDFSGYIPPNCHNPDEVHASLGPYRQLPNNAKEYMCRPSASLRYDNSGDFLWNAQGLLIALDYVPFSYSGAQVFLCPGEIYVKYDSFGGWGEGWNNRGLDNARWTAASNMQYLSSYVYGSSRNSQEYRLEKWANKVAMTDCVGNIPGLLQWDDGNRYRDSHSAAGEYIGFNRLFFDGHTSWFADPANVWFEYNSSVWSNLAIANNQGNWNEYVWKENLFDD